MFSSFTQPTRRLLAASGTIGAACLGYSYVQYKKPNLDRDLLITSERSKVNSGRLWRITSPEGKKSYIVGTFTDPQQELTASLAKLPLASNQDIVKGLLITPELQLILAAHRSVYLVPFFDQTADTSAVQAVKGVQVTTQLIDPEELMESLNIKYTESKLTAESVLERQILLSDKQGKLRMHRITTAVEWQPLDEQVKGQQKLGDFELAIGTGVLGGLAVLCYATFPYSIPVLLLTLAAAENNPPDTNEKSISQTSDPYLKLSSYLYYLGCLDYLDYGIKLTADQQILGNNTKQQLYQELASNNAVFIISLQDLRSYEILNWLHNNGFKVERVYETPNIKAMAKIFEEGIASGAILPALLHIALADDGQDVLKLIDRLRQHVLKNFFGAATINENAELLATTVEFFEKQMFKVHTPPNMNADALRAKSAASYIDEDKPNNAANKKLRC